MNNRLVAKTSANPLRAVLLAAAVVLAAAWCVPAWCSAEQGIPDRPLTLEECTVIALARNPQVTSSQQGLVSAQMGLIRARSSYYPELGLTLVEGRTGQAGTSDAREDLDLALRATLWRLGRKESVQESRASLRATDFNYTSTLQGLVNQVAGDYFGVLAAQQLVQVAQEGVAKARDHRKEVKARIDLGAAAKVDIYPAEDDLARAELDLIDARSNLRVALATLKNTMGVPPETELALAPLSPSPEMETPSLKEALPVALEQRPELAASKASLAASRSALAQAKIRRGPLMDVGAQYTKGYTGWEARDPSWNVLFTLSWPLFDGYATRADVTSAQASLTRAEADLQRLVNQVGLEVENALVAVERARERVEASAKSVAAAEARLAAAEGKYQQGKGILLEVIDARVAVTSARASQVRARYDYEVARVALQKVMGTLPIPGMEEVK